MNNDYLSISELNNYIKNIFDAEEFLRVVYIKGEISNFKLHSRGHLYFTLKDELSRLNAVMFSYQASNLKFTPKDGMSVLVRGKISVYPSSGSYQIYVEDMEEDGIGNLYVEFEKLKEQLSKEGLFSEEHKKSIPAFPKRIGIITASTGAAIKDILTTLNRRYPITESILFPTLVQGDGAKENIVKMIKEADNKNLDLIIVGRGGGSIEDLWAFNEEIVARAIYDAKTPIISAVGHEIDFTISDFVADLRAPTPTAAAELAVPNINDIKNGILNSKKRIKESMKNILLSKYEEVKKYKQNYILNNPLTIFEIKEQKLDTNQEKLNILIKNIIEKNTYRYANMTTKVELLNPIRILKKGYSITKKDNKAIYSVKEVKMSDQLNIKLSDGEIISEVKEIIINGKRNV